MQPIACLLLKSLAWQRQTAHQHMHQMSQHDPQGPYTEACMRAHRAPMQTPQAAIRGAPQKEATPPTHATASESFTLDTQHLPMRRHTCTMTPQDSPPAETGRSSLADPQGGPVLTERDASALDTQDTHLTDNCWPVTEYIGFWASPGIFAGILHNCDLMVGAVQAALQEVQHPWCTQARLAQPSAAPYQHLQHAASTGVLLMPPGQGVYCMSLPVTVDSRHLCIVSYHCGP